ncbi:MAG: hypothetical protein IIA10_05205 [Proteobacteria bacterium]|nr:hypothetical protein [Pseudomonadota bacterium]
MLLADFVNGSINVKRLDLTGMAAIAEVIGTIGIIASLIFVVVSINRNTSEVNASQMNVIYGVSRQIELAIASDPEWTDIILRGRSHSDQLSETEQYRYDVYPVAVIDLWDLLTLRDSDGLMDEDMVVSWHIYFHDWVKRYMTESDWQRVNWQYSGEIMTLMDAAFSTEPLN